MKQIQKQKFQNYSGFTLLELLVVLSILALLAGVVGPKVMDQLSKSKVKTAKVQIEELSAALDMYKLDVGRYPKSEQGMRALIEKPNDTKHWNGPYLKKNVMPQDPWMNDYIYVSPGKNGDFDLYSFGPDP